MSVIFTAIGRTIAAPEVPPAHGVEPEPGDQRSAAVSLTLVDLLEAGALRLAKLLHATGSSAMAVAAINRHWEAAQS